MAEKKIGTCAYCKKEFSKLVLKKHFERCEMKTTSGTEKEEFFLISVEGYDDKEYWLYISANVNSTLKQVDSFLRDIWLECCGHLSAFYINGIDYESSRYDSSYSKTMNIKLEKILDVGDKFTHDYDFGSTTTLKLKIISKYINFKRKKKVELIANNIKPLKKCDSCGEIADYICADCGEWVCGKCSTNHKCGEDMLLPAVNSPRVGVCSYCG